MLGARATDASGRTQPVEQPWNRGGFANNLVQRVEVVVPCRVTGSDGSGPRGGGPVVRPTLGGQPPKPESAGSEMSGFSSSSTLTSLNVITRTFFTKRAGRYMSHTQASCISTSK